MDYTKEKILALSWKQPYGSLMLHNKYETRKWPCGYRGYVLICTAKSPYKEQEVLKISGELQYRRIMLTLAEDDTTTTYGKAIAIGKLVDSRLMRPTDENQCFVQFNRSLYVHVYEEVEKITPFDWKGVQGWKALTEEFKKDIASKIS